MYRGSLRRLLCFSLALILGAAPTAAFATVGAASPLTSSWENAQDIEVLSSTLESQEIAGTGERESEQYDRQDEAVSTDADGQAIGSGLLQSEQHEQTDAQASDQDEPAIDEPLSGVFAESGELYYRNASGTILTGRGWHLVDGVWYYAKSSNGALATGWQKLGVKWYWLDPTTAMMVTGIQSINGQRYLFNASGAMLTGWRKLNGAWYYLKSSGAMATGWAKVGGVWYWLDPDTGVMATGWITTGGKSYYLKSSGAMATGWQRIGGIWYYLKSSGEMATGWQKLGGKWYWLDTKTGAMATDWKQINGDWYRFNSSGAMLTGWQKSGSTWYYLRSSGAMAMGWAKVGGVWYWLDPDTGAMHTGWLLQGGKWYWMDGSGAAAQNQIKVINGLGYAFDASCAAHYGHNYDLGNDETLTKKQQAIVNACHKVPSPGRGLCAEWVSQVFEYCGYPHLNLDACDMANDFCTISDLSKLKPGMLIAVKTHSHTWAGSIWGHVCIYIGDGKVMDNAGVIRIIDLEAWLYWYGDTVTPKWGWYNNNVLG